MDVAVSLAVTLPATYIDTLPLAVRVILLLPLFSNPLLIVVILPVVIIAVLVLRLPRLALPVRVRILVDLLKVKDEFPPKVDPSLNCTV